MKIDSSYDYTSLLSTYAAQKRTTTDTADDTTQSTASQAVTALMARLPPPDMGSSIMSLSASGQKVKDSIQRPEPPTEAMKAAMDQVRTDFESILSADVDSLSEDDAETLLAQLVSDMGSLPSKTGSSVTGSAIDVSSLSDAKIKDILQNIQDQLENTAESGKMPPPPPEAMAGMTWGFDVSELLSDDASTDTALSTGSTEMTQQFLDLLTESYDSASGSSSDYAAKLKESIAQMLEQQKTSMDDFASSLYSQLDAWSSTTQ